MSLPATQAAEKIRISVSGGYNMIFLSAGVAHYKGFFKDEGLDADIVVMGAAPSIAALTNGDIDYTMLTGTVIRAAIRGLPVRLLPACCRARRMCYWRDRKSNPLKSSAAKKSDSPASATRPMCWRD